MMERKVKNIINKVLKNIYKYENYRDFLKDFFVEQKRIKRHFSHRYLADKAGFSSPSFFHNVINGKRNLSVESIEKLSRVLDFKGKEGKFFTFLVLCNQA
jgi:uncharacterized protein (TIGR02147 family)